MKKSQFYLLLAFLYWSKVITTPALAIGLSIFFLFLSVVQTEKE